MFNWILLKGILRAHVNKTGPTILLKPVPIVLRLSPHFKVTHWFHRKYLDRFTTCRKFQMEINRFVFALSQYMCTFTNTTHFVQEIKWPQHLDLWGLQTEFMGNLVRNIDKLKLCTYYLPFLKKFFLIGLRRNFYKLRSYLSVYGMIFIENKLDKVDM